jgi:rubrerythrin
MGNIESVAELYAHAIAIESEAAQRYAEFAQRMNDEGRDDLAAVFAGLARAESEHLKALERRTEGVVLPDLRASQYKWFDDGPPENAARELVFRLMTPRQALAIALHAEQSAHAFFEHAYWAAADPGVRALAREMAADEKEHIAALAQQLEATPAPALHSTLIFER